VPKTQKELERIERNLAKNRKLVSRAAIRLEDLRAAQAALQKTLDENKHVNCGNGFDCYADDGERILSKAAE
jgi:hypothetical protein